MSSVRLLLKCQDGSLRKIYWLSSRTNYVHAWCFAADRMVPSLPEGVSCEAHWTYPSDGAVHTSLKFFGDGSELLATIHIWPELVRIKTLSAASLQLDEYLRHNSHDIAGFRVGYQAAPLSTYRTEPHFFSFASVSMPIVGEAVDRLPICTNPQASDLIVESDSARACFLAGICGAGFKLNWEGPGGGPQFSRTTSPGFPALIVQAFTG